MITMDRLMGANRLTPLLALLLLLVGCGTVGPSRPSAQQSAQSGHSPTKANPGTIDALVPLVVSFEGQISVTGTTNTMVRTPRFVPTAGPIVDLWLENESQTTESIGYDVFVADQPPPAPLSTCTVTLPSQWPGTVWDLVSVSGTPDAATDVPPGGKVAETVAWPATTTAGTPVPTGNYWVVVWATVNGSPFAFDWYWPYVLQ